MAVRNTMEERDTWVADSGCDGHVTNNMKWYINFVEFTKPRKIGGHSSQPTLAWGTGTALLPALRPGGKSELELQDVWFAPTSPYSMLSLNKLEKDGVAYDWRTQSLMWTKSEWPLATVEVWNGIKVVQLDLEAVAKLKDENKNEMRLAFLSVDFRVLHRRLMHAGYNRTVKVAEQAGIRLLNKPERSFHCESCELAKSRLIISRQEPTPGS